VAGHGHRRPGRQIAIFFSPGPAPDSESGQKLMTVNTNAPAESLSHFVFIYVTS
jgi:hypothetical protein